MDALRHFTTSEDGTILLKVPAAYTKRRLEIIILPADPNDEVPSPEASEQLQETYRPRPFSSNFSKIRAIAMFRELADNWDEEGAIAPVERTIASAEALANNLDLTGQKIYNTSPGPNGEILISLRNGQKNLELLVFPNKNPKIVSLSDVETPTQKVLTPENLKASLSWLNA